jgi:hypothetical protein
MLSVEQTSGEIDVAQLRQEINDKVLPLLGIPLECVSEDGAGESWGNSRE